MPDIARVLKDEIARIARKEAKAAINKIKKPTNYARKSAIALKKQVALLEREVRLLKVQWRKTQPQIIKTTESVEGIEKLWITARGIKGLRKRLGISQPDLAKLVGVSGNTVYMWEHRRGPLEFRGDTRAAIVGLRKIGRTEVRRRLEGMRKK